MDYLCPISGVAKLASRLSIKFIARSKLRYSGKLYENTFEYCCNMGDPIVTEFEETRKLVNVK